MLRDINLPLLRVISGHGALLLRLMDSFHEGLWAERLRIARELHDDVCQTLAFLHMQLGHVGDLIAGGRGDEAARRCGELKTEALEAYDATRQALDGLRVQPEPDESSDTFLERIARTQCRRCGLGLGFAAQQVKLGRETAWQLARVLQEAISNAAKHGKADSVTIDLKDVAEGVSLVIADNGAPSTSTAAGGGRARHGISIMRERLESLGGSLNIESSREGTKVVACLPLPGV